jgi:hypothetical protein
MVLAGQQQDLTMRRAGQGRLDIEPADPELSSPSPRPSLLAGDVC